MSPRSTSLLLASLFLLGGCTTTWNMPQAEMLKDMQDQLAKPEMQMSLLWYAGSDDKVHEFRHVVRAFNNSRIYRVPVWNMTLPQQIPLNSDDKDWMIVEQIGDTPLYLWKEADRRWRKRSCPPERRCLRLDAPAVAP